MRLTFGRKRKKYLLFLLSSLHEVWIHGISDMKTLVNDKSAVRTYYKKAIKKLHTDKNRNIDFKTKYIIICI